MKAMKDLYNKLSIQRAISPVSVADDTPLVSEVIDRLGYEAVLFAILTGTLGDAGATFAVLLEHDDDSGFGTAEAVPDDQLLGTEAAAGFDQDDDDVTRKLGYVGNKRYLRLTITPTGNATAALIAATAILGAASKEPVS